MKQDPFAKAGDICTNCASRWEEKEQPLMRLVALKRRTENYFFEIAVCKFCDGEPIIKIAEKHDAKTERTEYDE